MITSDQTESILDSDIRAIGLCIDAGLLDAARKGIADVDALVAFLPPHDRHHAELAALKTRYDLIAQATGPRVEP